MAISEKERQIVQKYRVGWGLKQTFLAEMPRYK